LYNCVLSWLEHNERLWKFIKMTYLWKRKKKLFPIRVSHILSNGSYNSKSFTNGKCRPLKNSDCKCYWIKLFCLAVSKIKFCYLIPEDDCRDDMEATEATLGGRSSVTSPVSTFSVSTFPVSTFSKWFVGDTHGGVSAGTIQAEVSCNRLEQYF